MKFVTSLAFGDPRQACALASAADTAGFDAISLSDHVVNPETIESVYPYTQDGGRRWEPFTPWPDPWVEIGAMAAVTERLRFLTGVYVLPMRDPVLYRIVDGTHHRTGDAWHVYPMYDFGHGLSDAIEGITHSLCTLEFTDHRPLYDWLVENVDAPSTPRQIEFARLNLTHTVMSKRVLRRLVEEGDYLYLFGNLVGSVLIGMIAVVAGLALGRLLP